MVKTDRVTKVFHSRNKAGGTKPKKIAAVDSVSLEIPRGEVFGLVGESGSGKTTFARCLLHLIAPSSGRVYFDGTAVDSLDRNGLRILRRKMQIIFQDPNSALNPRISVYRSLGEGLTNRGLRGEELGRRIAGLAEMVSIPVANLQRKPEAFSGGQRQRLVIARALSMEPDFLVLDEPVSNLDVSIQAQIINLLMDLQNTLGLTYLFISHDLNLVSYVSDTVGVMYSGQLVECGPVGDVLERPLHGYTRLLLDSAPRIFGKGIRIGERTAQTRAAAKPRESITSSGCAFREHCSYAGERCGTELPEMIDTGGGHLVACRHAAKQGLT